MTRRLNLPNDLERNPLRVGSCNLVDPFDKGQKTIHVSLCSDTRSRRFAVVLLAPDLIASLCVDQLQIQDEISLNEAMPTV